MIKQSQGQYPNGAPSSAIEYLFLQAAMHFKVPRHGGVVVLAHLFDGESDIPGPKRIRRGLDQPAVDGGPTGPSSTE